MAPGSNGGIDFGRRADSVFSADRGRNAFQPTAPVPAPGEGSENDLDAARQLLFENFTELLLLPPAGPLGDEETAAPAEGGEAFGALWTVEARCMRAKLSGVGARGWGVADMTKSLS